MRFLDVIRPLAFLTFQVKDPTTKRSYGQRIIFTLVVLVVFLVFGQVPLFGLDKQLKADQASWIRNLMASNRGTLMELGISPIITTQMLVGLMTGAKLIDYDPNLPEDRALLKAAVKFFSMLLTFGQAYVYVATGSYGPMAELGVVRAFFIVLQLTVAGVLLILLDETMSKGYGISQGGISLFIAVNLAENVMWQSLSPITVNTGRGTEFNGAVVNSLHLILTRPDKWRAVREAFFRAHFPNLFQVLATVFLFAIAVYLNGIKYEIRLRSTRMRGVERSYPIRPFNTQIPVILQAAIVQNIYMMSQILSKRYDTNPLIRLLGRWALDERTGQYTVQGGLAYYLQAPTSFSDVLEDPIHFILHFAFVVTSCAMFSNLYVEISGQNPRELLKTFRDNSLTIVGVGNESMYAYLDRTIKTAQMLGGATVGTLTVLTDLIGALGSGTSLLIGVQIISSVFEELKKEGMWREIGGGRSKQE